MSKGYCQNCGNNYLVVDGHICPMNPVKQLTIEEIEYINNIYKESIPTEEEISGVIPEGFFDATCKDCASDAVFCPKHNLTDEGVHNKYMREIKPKVWVDVYDVLDAFQVTDGAMAHALKKMLAIGKRGHKDEAEDRKDIYDSVVRSNQIFETKKSKK